MASTGTYTYNPTGSTLIEEALRLLGVLEEGGSVTEAQITDSLPTFEMYVKGLSKYGLTLWTVETQNNTLVDGTCSYVPAKKALNISDIVFRDSDGNDTILIPLTRNEYWDLNDKNQLGQPTQFYYDPQEDQAGSTIVLWPCPDSNNAGNGETIEYKSQILLEDVSSTTTTATETIDVPQEWLETIKYGLATRLAPMYGYPVQERNLLLQEYNVMLKDSLDWDTEQESIYISKDWRKETIGD